jgi:hypothetical protein
MRINIRILIISFLFLSVGLQVNSPIASARTFNFINKCNQTIYIGFFSTNPAAKTLAPNNGWKLTSGQSSTITSIPDDLKAIRVWGRTGCNFPADGQLSSPPKKACATGDCGTGVLNCQDKMVSGEANATLAEMSLRGAGDMDYYDVSLVDGFNIPIDFKPVSGTYTNTNLADPYTCGTPTCTPDLNQSCPADLRVTGDAGSVIACLSGCTRYNSDAMCCRNAFGTPATCTASESTKFFKSTCPSSYSWAYDDHTSTYVCKSADYNITYCPGGSVTPVVNTPIVSNSPVVPNTPVITPTGPILSSNNFSQKHDLTPASNVVFSIFPKSPMKYSIVHYLINSGAQQNVTMSKGAKANTYTSPEVLKEGDIVQVAFTYWLTNEGYQVDSSPYIYVVANGQLQSVRDYSGPMRLNK